LVEVVLVSVVVAHVQGHLLKASEYIQGTETASHQCSSMHPQVQGHWAAASTQSANSHHGSSIQVVLLVSVVVITVRVLVVLKVVNVFVFVILLIVSVLVLVRLVMVNVKVLIVLIVLVAV